MCRTGNTDCNYVCPNYSLLLRLFPLKHTKPAPDTEKYTNIPTRSIAKITGWWVGRSFDMAIFGSND